MALIAKQKLSRTPAAAPTYTAVSASDTFEASANTFVHIKNGGGASDTVTINSVAACDQGFDHDETFAVPAGQERVAGPWGSRFRNANGLVTITHSSTASVTIAVLEP